MLYLLLIQFDWLPLIFILNGGKQEVLFSEIMGFPIFGWLLIGKVIDHIIFKVNNNQSENPLFRKLVLCFISIAFHYFQFRSFVLFCSCFLFLNNWVLRFVTVFDAATIFSKKWFTVFNFLGYLLLFYHQFSFKFSPIPVCRGGSYYYLLFLRIILLYIHKINDHWFFIGSTLSF